MGKIILSAPGARAVVGDAPPDVHLVEQLDDLPLQLAPGRWTLIRRDRWLFDQRVVDMLRALSAGPGVELLDPTGLLGGSRYGYDIGREPAPIVQRSLRGRQQPKIIPREIRRAFS